MAVRTKQLAADRFGLPTGNDAVYSCPSGETAIVKDLQVSNRSAASSLLSVVLDPDGAVAPTFIHRETIPAGETRHLSVWWVLMPGDTLAVQANAGQTDTWFILLSGTELEGLAD